VAAVAAAARGVPVRLFVTPRERVRRCDENSGTDLIFSFFGYSVRRTKLHKGCKTTKGKQTVGHGEIARSVQLSADDP
jgi:hypothetical protein